MDQRDAQVKITLRVLDLVLRFADLARGFAPKISQPLKNKDHMIQVTTQVFADFADSIVDPDELAHMILASNYFQNDPLLDLLSAKMAITLANMDVPGIRNYFGITNPFRTPEDEERVKRENDEAKEIYDLDNDEY